MKKYFLLNILLFNILFLLIWYFNIWWFLPLSIFYLFLISFHYSKKSFLIIVAILSFTILFNYRDNKVINDNYNHQGIVVDVYSTSIVAKEENQYYYLLSVEEDVCIGDTITYNGYYFNAEEKGSFDIFLRSNKTYQYTYPKNLTIINKKENIRNNAYNSLIESDTLYSDYTLALLYKKETPNNKDFIDTINKIGVSHLFVISGLHISILYFFIERYGIKVSNSKKLINIVASLLTFLFLYLVYFPPTGLRALLTIMIFNNSSLSKTNALSIVGIIFFIFNPWIMLTSSMILSFSITFMIYEVKSSNNSLIEYITINMLAFYISLPIILSWETNINLFAPILTIVISPIITFSYIFCLILLPFQFLWNIFSFIFVFINWFVSICSILYLNISIQLVNSLQQIFLLFLTLTYIIYMKENLNIVFITFFTLSTLLFLI